MMMARDLTGREAAAGGYPMPTVSDEVNHRIANQLQFQRLPHLGVRLVMRAGVIDFLSKPFDDEQLLGAITIAEH